MTRPPYAGNGLHQWILSESRRLVLSKSGLEQGAIERKLFDCSRYSGRDEYTLVKEIHDAVVGALQWAGKGFEESGKVIGAGEFRRSVEWSPVNLEKQAKVLSEMKGFCIGYKSLISEPHNRVGKFSYWQLWGDLDFNVCAAIHMADPQILALSDWLKMGKERMEGQQYIVPSPLYDVKGRKTDENMCKRMYMVIEFDMDESRGKEVILDEQARLLWYLGSRGSRAWALAMVVWSGSKSLHGWFTCYHKTERQIKNFVLKATELGADRQMRIPSQYCRMPFGYNYKKRSRQEVVYYDPYVVEMHNEIVREDCAKEETEVS